MLAAKQLPFDDGSFDVVFSHEVIEHVDDDRQAAREMVRVLAPGGRIVIFCPNRLYPFETHGHFWRGKYHFGNTPLINYLPNPLRNRLAPHVGVYTRQGLREICSPACPCASSITRSSIPASIMSSPGGPDLGRWLRSGLYTAEHTPLQAFGLSHFLVLESGHKRNVRRQR